MQGYIRERQSRLRFLFQALCLVSLPPALVGVLISSCHAATKPKEEEHVQVEVWQVGFDRLSNSPVVLLQNKEQKKAMPIWIGAAEAQAIALELHGAPPPRPLTHDLIKNILEQVGVEFEKVVVTELKGSTYYAHIYLITAGKSLDVDSRPSDAIALALRFHRPIFVTKELFDSALPAELPRGRPEPASLKVSGVTVQNLSAELAAHFNLSDTKGVLVADCDAVGGEDQLRRGDVVLAVAGEAVHAVSDFRDKLRKEQGHPTTLQVRRDGKELGVQLTPTADE